jgi:hypothetical protein
LTLSAATKILRVAPDRRHNAERHHRMNIVQIVSGKGVNGAIRHCLDLTCELAERGHAVLLAHKPGAWIATAPLPAGVELFETTFERKIPEFRRVAAKFRQRQVGRRSLAHQQCPLLQRAALACVPVPEVATCHMPFFQPHWWLETIA